MVFFAWNPPPAPATFRGADLLVNHVAAMRAYHECRLLHRDLVQWVRNPTSHGRVRDE